MLEFLKRFGQKRSRHHLIWRGPDGCFATNRISRDGCKIGYMYREKTESRFPDSGWRFFEGTEDDAYINDPENIHIFKLKTICELDSAIVPYLNAPHGTAWERNGDGTFTQVLFEVPEDE